MLIIRLIYVVPRQINSKVEEKKESDRKWETERARERKTHTQRQRERERGKERQTVSVCLSDRQRQREGKRESAVFTVQYLCNTLQFEVCAAKDLEHKVAFIRGNVGRMKDNLTV